jgi:hypothetical protein
MSVYSAPKDRPRQQYIATSTFSGNFFTYATALNTTTLLTTGTLSAVTATATNCPAGRILRENGRRLFSNADPGVSTFMVGVVDSVTGLSGFIDPNASLFQNYTGARAAELADGLDYSVGAAGSNHRGPSVFTLGNVIAGVQLQSAAGVSAIAGSNLTFNATTSQYYLYTLASNTSVLGAAPVPPAGTSVYVSFSNAFTMSNGTTGLKLAAVVTPTAASNVTVGFVSDGTNLREFSRAFNPV